MAGTSLGTAYVQVVASAQGIQGSLTKALSGEASNAGSSAGSMLAGKIKGAIIAAGIGTALVAGIKSALAETGELQQSYLGGIDTLYGEAAEKAREYARAAQEAGISQSNYAQQAVSFGAALKQAYGGDTTQAIDAANMAILDMADNAAKMGTPLQSIQDAYQGFARGQYVLLDNLKLGYGGTKTEMERLLADAEQISGVHYDISNLGDVYNAIHVIQNELGLTGVAAEEAQSTLTGSFEGMKAAWQNLIGNIGLGENVEASMQSFTTAMSNYLFNNLFPTIGTIFQSLPTAISTFIQTGLPQFMQAGMQIITTLAMGAKTALPGMIRTMMTGLASMSTQLRANAGKFITVGLSFVKSIAQGIINNIPTFIQTVPKIITNIAGIINDNAPKLIATGISIIKSLVVGLVKAIPVLIENMPQILQAIYSAFMAFQWANLGKVAITGIAKGLKAMAGPIKTAAKNIVDKITAPIKAIPGKITGAISSIKTKLSFSGLASKVSTVFKNIRDKITEPITKAKEKVSDIISTIKGKFPFNIGKIINLKTPSISMSTGSKTVLGKTITYPKGFSVSWHAKAMEDPYMFRGATLFGAGESGDEVLYGRSALMRDISDAVGGNGGDIIVNLNYDASDDATDMLRDLTRNIRRYRMMGVV